MENLFNDIGIVRAMAQTAAGTTAISTGPLDMEAFNCESVCFVGSIDTSAANNTVKAQHGDKADGSDMTDLASTKLTPAGAPGSYALAVERQAKRYVQLVITRGTSTRAGEIYALFYHCKKLPISSVTASLVGKHVADPAEGTP